MIQKIIATGATLGLLLTALPVAAMEEVVPVTTEYRELEQAKLTKEQVQETHVKAQQQKKAKMQAEKIQRKKKQDLERANKLKKQEAEKAWRTVKNEMMAHAKSAHQEAMRKAESAYKEAMEKAKAEFKAARDAAEKAYKESAEKIKTIQTTVPFAPAPTTGTITQ